MSSETGPNILFVEDDPEILEFTSLYLRRNGFRVEEAATGREALLKLERIQPDLVLLDVILPEIQGFELCRLIRRQSDVPVIFLTCKWQTDDIIQGLDCGADDYLTKPFAPQELLARIRANLRRAGEKAEASELCFGPLQINLRNCRVSVHGKPVSLYAKELQLLLFLARNPNRVFPVETLYAKVWGDAADGDLRTVMVHISNLRRKIEEDPSRPRWIQTIRGFGYLFNTNA